MKKIVCISFLLLSYYSTSQESIKAQALKKGDIILDGYHGTPDYHSLYYRYFVPNYRLTIEDQLKFNKMKKIGPIGIRGEYLLTNKIGVGLNICFGYYSKNSIPEEGMEENYFKQTNLGIVPTFNYHFLQREKLDVYFNVGAGVTFSYLEYKNSSPEYHEGKKNSVVNEGVMGIGLRYFVTQHFAISSNLQLGQGGLFSGGISYKF